MVTTGVIARPPAHPQLVRRWPVLSMRRLDFKNSSYLDNWSYGHLCKVSLAGVIREAKR